MRTLIGWYFSFLDTLRGFPPLLFRLTLAYGFYGPAMEKLKNLEAVIRWFGKLGIPAPEINAYMSVTTECLGVVLLTLGLATRFISIPLIVVMIVAIATVHYQNGFSCGKNGFEVPFYYMLMLISLLIGGAGKYSLDALIARKAGMSDGNS